MAHLGLPDVPAPRPPPDGSAARLGPWAGRLRESTCRNALVHVLVNDTAQTLEMSRAYRSAARCSATLSQPPVPPFPPNKRLSVADGWAAARRDSGAWVQGPPAQVKPYSTVAWGSCGKSGVLGISTGTCGSLLYRARSASWDVALSHALPSVGSARAGGGVYRRQGSVDTDSKLREAHSRLLPVDAAIPTSGGVHVSWTPPPFPNGRLCWLVTDDPDRAGDGLSALLGGGTQRIPPVRNTLSAYAVSHRVGRLYAPPSLSKVSYSDESPYAHPSL